LEIIARSSWKYGSRDRVDGISASEARSTERWQSVCQPAMADRLAPTPEARKLSIRDNEATLPARYESKLI
jgi:hypothetical protein